MLENKIYCSLYLYLQSSESVSFPDMACHPEVRTYFFKSYFRLRIHHQCRLLSQAVWSNKHSATRKAKNLNIVAGNMRQNNAKRHVVVGKRKVSKKTANLKK